MNKTQESEKGKTDWDFLLTELQIYHDVSWRQLNRVWDVFKFYITLTTAAGGFVIALITTGLARSELHLLVSITAGLVTVIGILVYMELLYNDFSMRRTDKRLELVREQIRLVTSLSQYFENIEKAQAYPDRLKRESFDYSFMGQVRRVVRVTGTKTQFALINSVIGTIGLVTFFLYLNIDTTSQLIFWGFGVFFCFLLFHGFLANIKAKFDNLGYR